MRNIMGLEALAKISVLVLFTLYIGVYLFYCLQADKALEFPPTMLILFTLVFNQYFRKSTKREDFDDRPVKMGEK